MFYPPMLLETGSGPFSSSDYIFEPKFDGIRIIFSNLDTPQIYSRNGNQLNKQFPELLSSFHNRAILDGELIGLTKNGNQDFEGVMKRFRMRKEDTITKHISLNPVCYKVFDVLNYKGQDLRDKPLHQRKKILEAVLVDNKIINKVEYINEDGISLFSYIQNNNLEGMVAKKIASPYVGKRSSNWLKIINWLETVARIAGYRKKDNALLCYHEDGRMLGLVLHGMSTAHREAFLKIAQQLKHGEDSEYYYLDPLIKCKLKGRGFLSNGILRSPIFVDFLI